jgi:hypothetical protein
MRMKATCTKCYQEIDPANINVAADVAYCPSCNETFRLSNLIGPRNTKQQNSEELVPSSFDLHDPPKGVTFKEEYPKTIISASTRSPVAFFLVPFALVWSGGSLGGIYGTMIFTGVFNPIMALFGLPFLAGSVLLWAFTLMSIAGKIELTMDGDHGEIFTGVGSIGKREKFSWDEIDAVDEDQTVSYRRRGRSSVRNSIVLKGKGMVKFGSGLSEDKRY